MLVEIEGEGVLRKSPAGHMELIVEQHNLIEIAQGIGRMLGVPVEGSIGPVIVRFVVKGPSRQDGGK